MTIIDILLNWIQFKIEMRNYDKKRKEEHLLYIRQKWPLYSHRSRTNKYQKRVKNNSRSVK